MAIFDAAAVSRAANDDREFQIAARFWNTNLRLDASGESGDESYLVQIRDGRIAEFSRIDSSSQAGSDVTISAPIDDWREMLKPTPKPFFQDLMAAMTRENFRLDGDLLGFRPYYRATCRLVEIMRNIPAPQK